MLAVVTGTVLSLIGLFGYARLTNSTLGEPATASAATLLRRAAAQAVPPGEIGHYVYRVQVHNNGAAAGSGTVDVWFEGRTSPARSTQTVTLDKGAKPGTGSESGAAGRLLGRFIQIGDRSYGYDASHDALTLPSARNAAPAIVLPNEAYDGGSLAQSIEQLASRGAHVVALLSQPLDGVAVNVVQADGVFNLPGLRLRLYFDAQTNLLRGFDASSIDPAYPTPSWQVCLQAANTVPAASAPAGTFALSLGGRKRPGNTRQSTCRPVR